MRNTPYIICIFTLFVLLSCKGTTNSHTDNEVITNSETLVSFTHEGTLHIFKPNSKKSLISLDIEIADDAYQTETGLMYRNSIKDTQGMLFIFPDEVNRSFFMKNTRIPLDIIYINAKKQIVSVQKNAEPFNETGLPSNGVAKYVLEVNAGLYDTWGLSVNDNIQFVRFTEE